jgi:type I restriction enzyme S subunit
MSKIEELIQQHCPDGVEFKELGEVCLSISAGGDLPENYLKGQKFPTVELPYPIYSNGTENNALYGFTDSYRIDSEAVTISARGTIGYHTVRKSKFTPIVRLITLIPKKETISTKFLNYALDITPIGGTSGSIPQLTVPTVKKISIPIPPLPIQQEIVNILDKFTQLESELESELESRKKQYEYYRNELLNFEGKEVELKTLDKISLNHDSRRKPVRGSDRVSGKYPYYGASGIVDYVNEYIFDGDYLLVSEDGANLLARNTPIAFSITGKTWVNNHAHVLKFDNYPTRRFVEIYLNSIDLSKFISGAAQPKLNQENLNRIPIPIPPLTEQERIVGILDKFDALVNDISVGLPAEIAARRKQYEYYRGKLLDFKPLNH